MTNKTISLNGRWDVAFDPDNKGLTKKYYLKFPKAKPITVPGVWEQVKPGYDGAGWYCRTFDVKPAWKDKVVRIRFGAVNYTARVWVNGRPAGAHEGGYTPFVLDITGMVQAGKNTLTVRVVDPPRDKPVDGLINSAPLRQTDIPVWKAGWYHNFGGIWQSVELLVTGKTYIDNTYVAASCLRKRVDAACTVVNRGPARSAELRVTATAHKNGKNVLFSARKTVRLKKGVSQVSVSQKLKTFTAWDCGNPFLYDLRAELVEKDTAFSTDTVRFGIRDFDVKNGLFRLNGKRIVLKGYLQQGVYPVTLVFPHTREMAVKEMKLLKKNGYNYIRAHLKPSPPEILDLADEMGILVSAEPPMGWIIATPQAAVRAETEVRELVLRDRNRPSVIFWCMFNEILDEITRGLKRYNLMKITHELDPSRLVIGNSGSFSDKNGHTDCYLPYEKKLSPFTDAHAYYGATQEGLTKFREAGAKGMPAFISEFGAMEAPMQYKEVLANYSPAQKKLGLEDYAQYNSYYESLKDAFKKGGLKKIWKSPEDLITEIDKIRGDEARLEVSNIRVNPNWQGYAFCQLADASGEIFGACDLWRKPKRIFKGITAAGKTPWVTPFMDPRTVSAGQKMTLQTWLINEEDTGKKYKAVIDIKKGSRTVKSIKKAVTAKQWTDRILKETVKAPAAPGKYLMDAKLMAGSKTVCGNSMTFSVLPAPKKSTNEVTLFDLTKTTLAPTFEALGYNVEKGFNNYREKNRVNFFAMEADSHPCLVMENLGMLKRLVKAGGVLVLLQQALPLFWWYLLDKPVRRQAVMRNCIYMHDHPVFDGLPKKGIMDYEYLPVMGKHYNNPYDIIANGGQVIAGTLFAHMWTTPDIYFWGSALDVIPLGKGHVISCSLELLNNKSQIAENLLVNLVNYAHGLIRPGNEELMKGGRCIDEFTG